MIGLLLLLAAQDPPTAITKVRIIPVGKDEIRSGTILIRDGKFAEVGAEVKVPAGAKVVDGAGLVAFPGLVHAYSRLGLSAAPGAQGATAHHLAVDELNPSSEPLRRAAESGVTCLGLQPSGGTVAGQGAVAKPSGRTKESMVVERAAFLRITMQANTAAKEALRQALEAGRKAVEAEKKPPPKPAAPAPAPPPKPDEKVVPIARFLKGEIPALVAVSSAAEILHFWQVMEDFAEFKARVVLVASPEAWKAAEALGERKAWVLLRPEIAFAPQTRDRVNAAAELARAGVKVGLCPDGDGPAMLDGYFFRVGELVRLGMPRADALRAMTLTPAEFLGAEKRVGSIEAGKDADLILLDGDPLGAQTRVRRVFIGGRQVSLDD